MITAKIIKDSISPANSRITTFILEYPRFIHAEMMTHRVFSRNAASSRAIPIKKMIEDVNKNTAAPIHWGANQKGMQADEEVSEKIKNDAKIIWYHSRDLAVKQATKLMDLGIHKQICNRLLEPFVNIRVLLTATEFDNFFKLRAHKAAQPEIRDLAYKMQDLYNSNKPELKEFGEWHVPFSEYMPENSDINTQLKIATARAARLSYNSFAGIMDVEKDITLHDSLLSEGHFSPFEHSAQSDWVEQKTGNFKFWKQYRSLVECN
jgi:thymidylate synthase ThyX